MKVVFYKHGKIFEASCSVITPATMKSFIKSGWNILEYINN